MSRRNLPFPGTTLKPYDETQELVAEGCTIRTSGTYQLVGDVYVPEFIELEIPGDASTPRFFGRVEVREGVPCVVAFHYDATPTGDVRQSHLRAAQIDSLIMLAGGFAVRLVERDGRYDGLPSVDPAQPDVLESVVASLRAARGNRPLTDEFLREVAAVYRQNMHRAPTKAVKNTFLVAYSQAGNYVAEARRRGFLPPTSPGKKKG